MRQKLFSLALGLLALTWWTSACGQSHAATSYMEPVAKNQICMIQKYYMGPDQMTPVAIAGKTYYVCCQGCKDTLMKDPAKERFAIDPVSGKKVDKADAVLGKASNGQIHFFESVADRDAFRPTPTPKPSDD